MSDAQHLIERMDFMCLDERAKKAMRTLGPLVEKELAPALDFFYSHIGGYPEIGHFFSDANRKGRAKSAQLAHWRRISSGEFSEDYLRSARAIGQTHARVGIEPRWYIGGYALIAERLIEAAILSLWPRGFISGTKDRPAEIAAALGALVKAVFLDLDIAISTYIEAAKEGRRRAEEANAEAAIQQSAVIDAMRAGLGALARGDLTYRSVEPLARNYQQLQDDFNVAMAQMHQTMQVISASIREVAGASTEISTGTSDLSQRTEEQAASLEQTASSMEQISQLAKRNADSSSRANRLTAKAREVAGIGNGAVAQAVGVMRLIKESSIKIADIISVIDDIASQTNLLALNTAVEAARAGEAGRGFAVLASEVRHLAQRTSQAAKNINSLITSSSEQVQGGVVLVGKTGDALTDVARSVHDLAEITAQIAAASSDQSTGINQINTAIVQLDEVTQQNSALVEENAGAAKALEEQAIAIAARLQFFRLDDGAVTGGTTGHYHDGKPPPIRRAPFTTIRGGKSS